jgi:hypothetical protein
MRRVVLVTLLVALTAAPSAEAGGLMQFASVSTDALLLERGKGIAVIASRNGAILGHLRAGRLTVVDLGRNSRVRVRGEIEKTERLGPRAKAYWGTDIRFSILVGRWRVQIKGRGINASAQIRGTVRLRGTRGRYSIDNGEEHPWPRRWRTFRLGD